MKRLLFGLLLIFLLIGAYSCNTPVKQQEPQSVDTTQVITDTVPVEATMP